MEPINSETQGILERLEKLERQNRRLKQAAAIAILVLSSLVLMAQNSTRKTVEANAFFLVDENGNRKAELSMTGDAPTLTMYGTGEGKVTLVTGEGASSLILQEPDGKGTAWLSAGASSSLSLTDDKGTAGLQVSKARPSLWMDGVDGTASLNSVGGFGPTLSLDGVGGLSSSLFPDALGIRSREDGDALLRVDKGHGPYFAIMDRQGFRSVLGVTETVGRETGEQHQKSAAALTMFNKEGKVIWSAP